MMNEDTSLMILSKLFDLGRQHGSDFTITHEDNGFGKETLLSIGKHRYSLYNGVLTMDSLLSAYSCLTGMVGIEKGWFDKAIAERTKT